MTTVTQEFFHIVTVVESCGKRIQVDTCKIDSLSRFETGAKVDNGEWQNIAVSYDLRVAMANHGEAVATAKCVAQLAEDTVSSMFGVIGQKTKEDMNQPF
jgi:hypothetical protein